MNLEQLKKIQKSLAISINFDEKKKEDLRSDIKKIEKLKKDEQDRLDDLSINFDKLSDKFHKQTFKVEKIDNDLKDKKNKVSLLEEEIAGLDITVIDQKERMEKDLKENVKRINDRMIVANKELLSKSSKLDNINMELDDSISTNKELLSSNLKLEHSIDSLEDDLKEKKESLVEIGKKEKGLKESIAGYKSQIESFKDKIKAKSQELSSTFEDVVEAEGSLKEIVKKQEDEAKKLEGMRGYRFNLSKKGHEIRRLFDILQEAYKEANMDMPKVKWDVTIPEFEDLDNDNIPKNI